ncbi:ABC transporter permease [Bosea sp. (in: a-proteobacteria)]|uniref:ABC transporter permease n=1 Tax=Bosea sp. (in: a-proteobacteria) TaxID=1871050 RepID=UPI0025C22B3B|nr:ABC transporter permease [Bosea sp. (in: a-proteobacteria)]MBR3192823.1 ABC transporter permease [Bosea sp. (in: a-proteobacteria)]
MIMFILRRCLQAALVLAAVSFVSFAVFRYVGDPVSQMVGVDATAEQREQIRHDLGLDQPFYAQFGRFVAGAVQGNFGLSLKQGRPVGELMRERVPATLELSFVSGALAVLVGVPLGVVSAIWRRSWLARAAMALSLLGISLPTFFIGVVLILVFGVEAGWLPSFGRGETVALGNGWSTGLLTLDGWRHLLLPAITLALFQLALIIRLVRGEMLEVLRSDFIRFARARGLSSFSIYFRHALRNALVPVVTIIGLQLGSIIAFALVTETVFQWPGMGLLFAQAVAFADVPVMAAYLCLIALVFVTINLAVDLLYLLIDPRVRSKI